MSTILAIDDDKNILNVLEKQLQNMGHKPIVAVSSKQGIELAKSGTPDLVLLDIIMPELDGIEVIKQLKKDELTKHIPIIMLTSKSKKDDVIKTLRYGVIDYVIKPHNYYTLETKISSALIHGDAVREKDYLERTENISVSRHNNALAIAFWSKLSDPAVIHDAKGIFNEAFLKIIKNDIIVLDLRGLVEFQKDDVVVIEKLITILGNCKVNMVAGKYYGSLVQYTDVEDSVNLFITYGDFEIFAEGL
jgi:twitching motility two-component system response regulator PilH